MQLCRLSGEGSRLPPAIWCILLFSPNTTRQSAASTKTLKVTNATLTKVPFDLDHWTKVASERYPNGLPLPYSDDPTQWIFHGHPCGSVVWDEAGKWTAHGPLRTDPTVLQVAVARLLGYRWPAEQDAEMELADEQREWVQRCEELLPHADKDGIVCIPSVRGESPAGDRLLALLAAAFGDDWNDGVLGKLLAQAGTASLDDYLRNRFFDEHCKLFHHRPFVWHIHDGRRDGFHALVSYHKLAEDGGRGRQLLESLTWSYLGDWITRQRDGVRRGEGGADDRLVAALELQERLAAILEGEPPFDIFVRWKPLKEQPIGWEPDINDGVRLNIRPFMAEDIPGGKKGAGILRAKPNLHWRKDRGKEPLTRGKRSKPPWLEDDAWDPDDDKELRPREEFPWFWPRSNGEFTAVRTSTATVERRSLHRHRQTPSPGARSGNGRWPRSCLRMSTPILTEEELARPRLPRRGAVSGVQVGLGPERRHAEAGQAPGGPGHHRRVGRGLRQCRRRPASDRCRRRRNADGLRLS